MSYETLTQMVRACEACPLGERGVGVPGEYVGDQPLNAALDLGIPTDATVYGVRDVMVIGEAPGGTEQHAGRPFIGSSGQLLRTMLADCGLESYYITNIAKHRPWVENRKQQAPSKDTIKACSGWLLAEWKMVEPKKVILLGATAAKEVLKLKGNPSQSSLVNRVYPFPFSAATALVLFHPAYFLHNRTARYVQKNINDWQRALRNFLGADLPTYPIEKVECIIHG